MAMLIERVLKTNGRVEDCEMVLAASNQYKQSQDLFSQYFAERIILDADSTLSKSNLYEDAKVWYANNASVKCPTAREFADNMDKLYRKNIKGKWKGIAINFGNDNEDDNEGIDIPDDVSQHDL
jgi:hypothetical protein